MNTKIQTQSLLKDFDVSDYDSEKLSDLLGDLTEYLETLEEKRKTVKSLSEVSETLSQSKDYLSGLSDLISEIETLETFKTSGLSEDLEDLEKETDRLRDYLETLDQTDLIVFLGLTPVMIQDYYDLEDRPEILILISGLMVSEKVSDLIFVLTEDLQSFKEKISKIFDRVQISRYKIEETAVSLGIIPKIDGSDHGLDLSGLSDLESRISQTLSLLTDCLINVEEISDSLDQVSESFSLFSEDIKTRQKRLTVRYFLTKDKETREIVSESLREKVSISFLDSGGSPKYDPVSGQYIGSSDGYGRNFERNSLRDFESESRVSVDIGSWGLTVSISLFHWLCQIMNYDPLLDSLFIEYSQTPDLDSESWLYCQSEFLDSLDLVFPDLISGLYGDGSREIVNTYNHDSLLSQVIQYGYFEIDGSPRVCLSIHGGADVRGGYSRPVMYSTKDDQDGSEVFRDSDLYAWIEDPESDSETLTLYSDDGYHLYLDSESQISGSPYDWKTSEDNMKERQIGQRLEEKISQIESQIEDFVTYCQRDSETDSLLSSLLKIRDQKVSDLEDWTEENKYNWRRSLSLDSFRCMEPDDLLYMDSEELIDHFADRSPVIFYREDLETGDPILTVPGLGVLYFDF